MTQTLTQVTAHRALETRQRMKGGAEPLARTWLPAPDTGEPRGTVILVHGIAEHNDRCPHVAKVLTDLGLCVRALDLRGHGKSGGPRMTLDAQDNYPTDLAEIVDVAVAEWHGTSFALGHSMGGSVVVCFIIARTHPVRGVLLSSSALRVKLPPGAGIMRGLPSALAPKLAVPNPVDPAKLSYDPSIVAAYRIDPPVQGMISALLLEFMLNAITQAQQDAFRLEAPMLLTTGGADSIVDSSDDRDFYVNALEDLRTLAWLDNGYRETLNEAEPLRSEVFGEMTEWLASRI